ncbi:MAG: hypothetical protein HY689_00750 [Chloroflexi bacterium]|nr:hypothetical protein [Chloroflexota bacterium]
MGLRRSRPWQGLLQLPLLLAVVLAIVADPPPRPTHAASPTDRVGKIRWAYHIGYDPRSFESLSAHIADLDYVSPYWYRVDGQGNLVSTLEAADRNRDAVAALARRHGVKLVPMIKNSVDRADFHAVLADPALRSQTVDRLVALAVEHGYDGIHIDFEDINPEDRPHLTAFMAALAPALRARGKLVTQAVAAKPRNLTTGWAGPYDYAALAPHNDLVVLMAYGYGTGRPQPTAPYAWVEGSVAFAASQMGPEKVLLGVAWYGYDWNLTAGGVTSLRWSDAARLIETYRPQVRWDPEQETSTFRYEADGQAHEVWFENARSVDARLDLVFKYGLAGAAGWRLGHEDPAVWESFRARLGYQVWYLAEGCTCAPFHTWVLVMNPNPRPANIVVTWMLEGGETRRSTYTLVPTSRLSIFANQVLPGVAFATRVEADAPVLVERAMYFGHDGHNAPGVTAPRYRWYLPGGSTRATTHTWVLLMNPNPQPAQVTLTLMRDGGAPPVVRRYDLAPTSRLNVFLNEVLPGEEVAVQVEGDLPVVAERASYFGGGGHASQGAFLSARTWYLPEGYTGHTSDLMLMNPNPQPAAATVTLMLEQGAPVVRTYQLAPTSRTTVRVNGLLPPTTPYAAQVDADLPVVAERASYFFAGPAGHSSLGVTAPAFSWFLAEGSTGNPFQEYVLIVNPNPRPTRVRLTFMKEDGTAVVREWDIGPQARSTAFVNQMVPNTAAVSVRVDATLPVVAERAMYFGGGGHDSVGVPQ